jgi:hypothetical protein
MREGFLESLPLKLFEEDPVFVESLCMKGFVPFTIGLG